MNVDELIRRQLLQQIYDKMSESEKATFAILMIQDRQHTEITESLQRIEGKQNWLAGYTSDLLANFTSAGILWLGSKLLSKI